MHDFHDLELMLLGHAPIIVIESHEENRILHHLTTGAGKWPAPLFRWSITEGLKPLEFVAESLPNTTEASEVLRYIKNSPKPGYYVLLDLHPYLDDPINVRLIKEIALGFNNQKKYLILISHELATPAEIQPLVTNFSLRLPDQSMLKRLIHEEAMRWKQEKGRNLKIQSDTPIIERLALNLAGLNTTDARRMIRLAIERDGAITTRDLPELMKAKYQLMAGEGVITFEYDTASFADIGGLEALKSWLKKRHVAFKKPVSAKDQPKGIMLLGVQGCGKSLAARAVAGVFEVPLLRLDFGALYNKYHGETERNLRQALKAADAMAPCVLWIDEMEKGLATSDSDDGVSRRVLGSLLTWMAERTSKVFVVATSNDISRLPPELIRKGRLDEIFFVDLPDTATREQIFRIHLGHRRHDPAKFDLKLLAENSEAFSGAEIEQAVVSALYSAQSHEAELNTDLLLAELAATRPLSTVMKETIDDLRQWAAGRTVAAD